MLSLKRLLVLGTLIVAGCTGAAATPSDANTTKSAARSPAQDSLLAHVDRARILGNEKATVWVVMASDFQCPFCKRFHDEVFPQIMKQYVETGKIRVAYLNYPMPFHQYAVTAAQAAMCAGSQDKFWQMHDGLFATQDAWADMTNPQPLFDSLATSLALDMPAWKACVTNKVTVPMIERDREKGKAGGVTATPSFFIGDRLAIIGAEPWPTFKGAIDSALVRAGVGGKQPE